MDNLTTETATLSAGYDDVGEYKLLVLIFGLLIGCIVLTCTGMAFKYYSFRRQTEHMLKRAQEELERGRRMTTTVTETVQGLPCPRACGIEIHEFDDPPPRYDQVCNDDEPPPSYETLWNSGSAERRSSATVNEQITGRVTEFRAHEGAPSYSAYIPPDRSAPLRGESINPSDATINIFTTLRQMQNYTEEVRERFSGNVDLFISSLSITTPPPSEHRTT